MGSRKQAWILILTAVAMALVNVAIIGGWFDKGENEIISTLFRVSLIAGIVLLFLLAIVALVTHNNSTLHNPVRERQAMIFIKLGLVPFFLFGALVIFVLLVLPSTFVLTPLVAAAGWLVMIIGSVWAICYTLSLVRIGAIGSGTAALFIIMEFFFVLDVIAAIILFFIGKSYEKKRISTK